MDNEKTTQDGNVIVIKDLTNAARRCASGVEGNQLWKIANER
jgi:hypothetical protein